MGKIQLQNQYIGQFPSITVIELDLYPYSGFTYKTNDVVIKETALNRGLSAYDYASPPSQSTHINTTPQNSSNSEGDIDMGCFFYVSCFQLFI